MARYLLSLDQEYVFACGLRWNPKQPLRAGPRSPRFKPKRTGELRSCYSAAGVGQLGGVHEKLVNAFNPVAAAGVICCTPLAGSWDGRLCDCDFSQMLELTGASPVQHIRVFDLAALRARTVVVDQPCNGCTAGRGSRCGGAPAEGDSGRAVFWGCPRAG
ncbi:DUF3641 domain-containing protein [Hymenobacter fodinae]|uniref:DUF3641 domain-containing protein n=1 Tax=Hymenobacter fodinae TaxID=2510796 RepID=A0A4Z0P0A5_9BACT|nr:DUF3641 domain-containing protein [Hymenobacter fodinae]TGE03823.1 DUF3641 domain-containing protein [Hymenobacter fodinae]